MMCLETLLDYCKQHGIKLTALRQEILTILSQNQQPMSAYDILEAQQKSRKTANIMSTYRILDFFIANDLCHKINSNNTYTLCCHPNKRCCQLLICRNCGQKYELHTAAISNMINQLTEEVGFKIDQSSFEITGLCHQCKEAAH